ncbi:MAG: hypothetical protein U0R50_00380 [Gaiellales bacterium]
MTILDTLRPLEDVGPDVRAVVICHLASGGVAIDEAERKAAGRRALLLLATGGDPRRSLELDGRAVAALADDLETPERRQALLGRLDELRAPVAQLPEATATLAALIADPELAWRGLAAALLADMLADE